MNNHNNRKKIDKVWGYEDIIYNGDYCGKQLVFNANSTLSIHFHSVKKETFMVSQGEIELTVYDNPEIDQYVVSWENWNNGLPNLPKHLEKPQKFLLKANDSFNIPVGMRHTITSTQPSVIIEFSTHDDPEDSYRILPSFSLVINPIHQPIAKSYN